MDSGRERWTLETVWKVGQTPMKMGDYVGWMLFGNWTVNDLP